MARDLALARTGRRRSAAIVVAMLASALVLALLVVDGSPAGPPDASAQYSERPNVVVILTDDQRNDSIAAMPYVSSRQDWVEFDQALVNTSLCCPSRATLLTGLTSDHHGIRRNEDAPKFDGRVTIADRLDAAGYETGFFGKYLNAFPWGREPGYRPDGWDRWVSYSGTQAYRNFDLNVDGTVTRTDPVEHSTDLFTDAATDFIDGAAGEQPFFALVSYFAPHGPSTPADRHENTIVPEPLFDERFLEADVTDKPRWIRRQPLPRRREMIEIREEHDRALLAVDEGVEAIFGALAAAGELDETIVIFSSDHGIAMGEHRYDKKTCPYEVCSRVPLLVRMPGLAGREEGALVSNIDLMPTIADYTRVDPGPVDGTSLRPLFERTSRKIHNGILLRRARGAKNKLFSAIRTRRYKFVIYTKTKERELYDLRRDPLELDNLLYEGSKKSVKKSQRLKKRLVELRRRDPLQP